MSEFPEASSPLVEPTRPDYPVQLSITWPEGPRGRLSALFRLFAAIPVGIALLAVSGSYAGGGLLFIGPLLLILFRRKYPRWWFDWNLELLRFNTRFMAYLLLLRDEYPSTDEQQAVKLDISYPEEPLPLNRWLPLVKWLLALPHYIVLFFLNIGVIVVAVVSWFAILITGRLPRPLFTFQEGVLRWSNRVIAYAWTLTTDAYPPFRLSA